MSDTSFAELIAACPDFSFLQSATDRISFADHLIRHLPIIVVDQDESGRIRWASDPALESTGYTSDELVGKPVEALVPDEHRKNHVGHRVEFNADPVLRPMGTRSTLRCRRLDGSLFPVEVVLIPSTINGENVVVCLLIDMSQREQP